METETIYEVVKKLIGPIDPIGESNTDDKRYKNLKTMTLLIDVLLTDINDISYLYKNNHQYSMKRVSRFAKKFLDQIGINH